MRTYNLSVEVGYELRTVNLTQDEYDAVRNSVTLCKEVRDFYEGEEITYLFAFNRDSEHSLVVTYDSGVGFLGSIDDAHLDISDR